MFLIKNSGIIFTVVQEKSSTLRFILLIGAAAHLALQAETRVFRIYQKIPKEKWNFWLRSV